LCCLPNLSATLRLDTIGTPLRISTSPPDQPAAWPGGAVLYANRPAWRSRMADHDDQPLSTACAAAKSQRRAIWSKAGLRLLGSPSEALGGGRPVLLTRWPNLPTLGEGLWRQRGGGRTW
jgi:hypothetical protein